MGYIVQSGLVQRCSGDVYSAPHARVMLRTDMEPEASAPPCVFHKHVLSGFRKKSFFMGPEASLPGLPAPVP